MRTFFTTALLLLLASSRTFAAAPGKVAIAVDTSSLKPKLAKELQDGIASEVATGLGEVLSSLLKTRVELAVVPDVKVTQQVMDCQDAECLEDLAQTAKVDLVAQVKVLAKKRARRGKRSYTISMIVAQGDPNRQAWNEQSECKACGSGDIKHMASLLASTIAERIDLRATRTAPPPAPKPVVVAPPPPPPSPPPVVSTPAPKPVRYIPRALSISAMVGGAALAGTGIYLLSRNGEGTCDPAAGQRECERVYDTKAFGTTLLVGGGAAIVGGLVGLVFFPPVASSSRVALGFTGNSISVRGAF